jgi:hypothetical protein
VKFSKANSIHEWVTLYNIPFFTLWPSPRYSHLNAPPMGTRRTHGLSSAINQLKELDGACAPGYPKCVVPRTDNCKVDQACPATAKYGGWGYCWAENGISGPAKRYRGQDMDAITQSFCMGGGALVESESCAPGLKEACTDQTKCQKGSSTWKELLTTGGTSPASSMCAPSFSGMVG